MAVNREFTVTPAGLMHDGKIVKKHCKVGDIIIQGGVRYQVVRVIHSPKELEEQLATFRNKGIQLIVCPIGKKYDCYYDCYIMQRV